MRTDCWCLVSNSYQPSKPAAIVAVIVECFFACNRVQLFLILARSHTVKKKKRTSSRDMSGIGRPRTSSFAEPPGVPGTAAATAGSAAVLVGSTGKSGVPQASGGSSSGCSNLKLASKLCLLCY